MTNIGNKKSIGGMALAVISGPVATHPEALRKHEENNARIEARRAAEENTARNDAIIARDLESAFDLSPLKDEPALRIYLSGPMKGYPNSNYPLFAAVALQLRRAGHLVYNPAEFYHEGPHSTFPLRKAFSAYSKFICEEADTIVLLPAWEQSSGVSAELALAKTCGLRVIEFKDVKMSLDALSKV